MEFILELDENDVADLDGGNAYEANKTQELLFNGNWSPVQGSNTWDYPTTVSAKVQSSSAFPLDTLVPGKQYKITIEEVV